MLFLYSKRKEGRRTHSLASDIAKMLEATIKNVIAEHLETFEGIGQSPDDLVKRRSYFTSLMECFEDSHVL